MIYLLASHSLAVLLKFLNCNILLRMPLATRLCVQLVNFEFCGVYLINDYLLFSFRK